MPEQIISPLRQRMIEAMQLRGLSERTLLRQWQKARLYLHHWLQAEHG